MRLSWFSPTPHRRRRGAKSSRRRTTAPLSVRRLERRRVLDASIQTIPAALGPDGPLLVSEGTAVTASATFSDAGPHTFDWSLTQGGEILQSSVSPTFNFVVPEDGIYTIDLNALDSGGLPQNDSLQVIVSNVAPLVMLDDVPMINENGSVQLAGSFSDPGLQDAHTLVVDWDDANNPANSTFALPVLQDAGGVNLVNVGDTFNSSTDTAVLTITAVNYATGEVGFSVQHQYLDDGLAPGNSTADDTSTIQVVVIDDDQGVGSDTAPALVKNVSPFLALDPVTMINENGIAMLDGTFTDPGRLDRHTLVVDWDDPNQAANSTFDIPALQDAAGMSTLSVGDTFSSSTDSAVLTITSIESISGNIFVGFHVEHQYFDDGPAPGNNTADDTSTIAVTLSDDDTLSTSDSQTVLVKNVVPQLTDPPDATIFENGTVTLITTIDDDGTLDVFSVNVDWQDGVSNAITGLGLANIGPTLVGSTLYEWNAATRQLKLSHQYVDDGASPGDGTAANDYLVTLLVGDDDTGVGDLVTTKVTVQNVPPAVVLEPVTMINENGVAILAGNYTDRGRLDGHTLTVDWDDPNNTADSTFAIPALRDASGVMTLNVGDTFASSTDVAELTITSIVSISGNVFVSFSVQHQYLDDGLAPGNTTADDISTITVTVADDDTGVDTSMAMVLVKNVAPTLTLDPVTMIDENSSALLSGTYNDPGRLDGHTLIVDWDDPNNAANSTFVIPPLRDAGGSMTLNIGDMFSSSTDSAVLTITSIVSISGSVFVSFSVQHQYLDDGLAPGNNTPDDSSTIAVTLTDDDTGVVSNTQTVLVKNVAPALTPAPNQIINEGQLLNLPGPTGATSVGSFTDVGTLDLHRAQIDWGDGNPAVMGTVIQLAGGGFIVGSHTYADDGVYTVIIRLADDDMSSFLAPDNFNTGVEGVDYVQATFTVTVINVAPLLTDAGPNVINEGQAFVLSNLPGGSLPNMGIGLSDPGFDNPLNPTTPTIGDPFQETFTGFTIDWGDGTADTPVTVVMRLSGSPGVPTTALFDHAAHTYADNGVYTVRIRVADDNMTGNFATGTNGVDFVDLSFTITVNNVAPTLANLAPSAPTISENGSVNFTVAFSDPGFDNPANDNTPPNGGEVAESFTFDINWGDGRQTVTDVAVADLNGAPGILSTGSFGGTHIFADDGTYTVTVTIHDDDSGSHSLTFSVVVQNVAPTIRPDGAVPPFDGDDVTSQGFTRIRVLFDDPGFDNVANPNPLDLPNNISDRLHESFTHVIDWGDGTVDAVHTYAAPGVYTVLVTTPGSTTPITLTVTVTDISTPPVVNLVGDQLSLNDNSVAPQPFTYTINWGDDLAGDNDAIQTVTLMLKNPVGTPFVTSQTRVVSSLRTSGGEGVPTTGSFDFEHRYIGPPNPDHPTDPIPVSVTIIDDNMGLDSAAITISNPGINTNMVAIDTTPEVPRLEFLPARMADVFLGQITTSLFSIQSPDLRVVRTDQSLTSDVYLELVVVLPDGTEQEGIRLPDDALQNLRELFSRLPDNRYKIFLVRTENNSRRLVMEVVVRGGRVVDPSDDSEGTRDRPPTSEQAEPEPAAPLDEDRPSEPAPLPTDQSQNDNRGRLPVDVQSVRTTTALTGGSEVPDPDTQPPARLSPPQSAPSPRLGHVLRRAAPLVGIGLAAGAGEWSKQVAAAFEAADQYSWQRLRRAGRLGRIIRPFDTPNGRRNGAPREYNESSP